MVDPEAEALRLAEMRRLQRQMKGVKLQYIAENDSVFFDDVAGIGEAKVSVMRICQVVSGQLLPAPGNTPCLSYAMGQTAAVLPSLVLAFM